MRSIEEIIEAYWQDSKEATVFQALTVELIGNIRDILASLCEDKEEVKPSEHKEKK